MKRYEEPTTVGLSTDAHEKLKGLQERGEFEQMSDGYRFAIALALFRGADPPARAGSWTTYLNVGSLDPDGSVFTAVETLRSQSLDEPVWKTAERLADWGVEELHRMAAKGRIPIAELLKEAADKSA